MMGPKLKAIIALIVAVGLVGSRIALAQGPVIGGCPVLPANNIWNTPIDTLPVDPNSNAYVTTIGASTHPHADFGSGLWNGAPIGIPFVVVPASQPMVTINISPYGSESDPGPYPFPSNAPIEGGPGSTGDRHVLVLRQGECKLYELYRAFPNGDGSWNGESGAVYDLNSNALRPAGWTSADAAGLPILPGLARYEEVAAGEITQALRFSVPQTRKDYVWPARHFASSSTDPNRPPMGQRFRLKASFVIDDSFSSQGKVILTALKKYGLILADNGSAWYISGAPNGGWDNDALADDFARVSGSDFEAVDVSALMVDPNSGQVIPTDDFTIGLTPASQAIEAGAGATYTLNLTALGNFSGTVTLAASHPALNLSVTPASLTPPGQATLSLTDTHPAGPLLPGVWYSVPVTATGGGLTRTTSLILLVGGARNYLPVILK
jgi:hypothetical protein